MFAWLVDHVHNAGGFVNPALKLLVGDEAEYGRISLAGVADDQLAAFVPYKLAEIQACPGVWLAFLDSLGYDTASRSFWRCHCFGDGVYPVIGAANHSKCGGRLEARQYGFALYGCTFAYSDDEERLLKTWDSCSE